MINQLLRSTFAFAVAASATMIVVAGSAAPVAAAETVTVNVAAWNLNSAAGRSAAEAAIEDAASHVCETGTPEQAAAAMASRACYRTVMATALPQLDAIAEAGSRTTVASVSLTTPGR